MHEMVMAAIIPPPPTPSSDTWSGVVDPTGSTVVTWNHKNYSISIISYTVRNRMIHKQQISSEFTTTDYNPLNL